MSTQDSAGCPPLRKRVVSSSHNENDIEQIDLQADLDVVEGMEFGTEVEINVEDDDGAEEPVQQKMKRTPVIWQQFQEQMISNKVYGICKHCKEKIAADSRTNGTTGLKNHIKACKEYPDNNRKRVQENTLQSYVKSSGDREGEAEFEVCSRHKKFSQEITREALCKMIVLDELPFKFVENEGFWNFISMACPSFIVPSRLTIARDCLRLFDEEKLKLQRFFKKSDKRICLTTDMWTSNQNISYMCLTAHFIDDLWVLQKRILNFMPCSSHKGDDVGSLIEMCLNEWGINKVFTITVDNASSNDTTCNFLKRKFYTKGTTVCDGKYLQVRCVHHIINLAVRDGLRESNKSIERIRAVVKYVKQSPTRATKFKNYIDEVGIKSKKELCLDVPTRWNSVYMMLSAAVTFKDAFNRYELNDAGFRAEFLSQLDFDHGFSLGGSELHASQDVDGMIFAPSSADWNEVAKLVKVLKLFYDLTVRVSASSYVTANIFLDEVSDVYEVINSWSKDANDSFLRDMASRMKVKFDKYWGGVDKMNMLLFVAAILDPRCKMSYVEISLKRIYDNVIGTSVAIRAKQALVELFLEYKTSFTPSMSQPTSTVPTSSNISSVSDLDETCDVEKLKLLLREARMVAHKIASKVGTNDSSELEKYLNECAADSTDFKILQWWKDRVKVYPIVSRLAVDVLAMPISTVSSESAFSTGGRVISDFRASLSPKMVQILVCYQDWIRQDRCRSITYTTEEDTAEIEAIEQGKIIIIFILLHKLKPNVKW